MNSTLRALLFFSLLVGSVVIDTSVYQATAAPILYDVPLGERYRRLEVIVPKDFKAKCNGRKGTVTCKVSIYDTSLTQVGDLKKEDWINVVLNEGRKEVRFVFSDPQVEFKERLLEGPPRWVIEVGST